MGSDDKPSPTMATPDRGAPWGAETPEPSLRGRFATLRGRRVRLRLLSEADLPARLEMTNDPEVQRETVGVTVGQRTPVDIRSWFRTLRADPGSLQIAIEDADGRYVGDLDLHSLDPHQHEAWVEPMIGDHALRAQGSEAVAAVLEDALRTLLAWVFQALGLHRVRVEVLSTNPITREVVTSLGFTDSGQIDHMSEGLVSHLMEITAARFTGSPPSHPAS